MLSELENLLRQGLAEIEAGRGGELADARKEAARWRAEWQDMTEFVRDIRESRIWAEQSYFAAKTDAEELRRKVAELERENQQLRELLCADEVQIKLLERKVDRLTKTENEK